MFLNLLLFVGFFALWGVTYLVFYMAVEDEAPSLDMVDKTKTAFWSLVSSAVLILAIKGVLAFGGL